MDYLVMKWLHILSATLILGTGLGTAFFMFCTHRLGPLPAIATVARIVVWADWLFTTPAVVFQPLSGWYLLNFGAFQDWPAWALWSLGLYGLAGVCWIPVVWIQMKLYQMARHALEHNTELPAVYWRYERLWTLLGIPAFAAMIGTYYLMVVKPF